MCYSPASYLGDDFRVSWETSSLFLRLRIIGKPFIKAEGYVYADILAYDS